MADTNLRHVTLQLISGAIRYSINAFLIDRRGRLLSPNTINFYSRELKLFTLWLDDQGITMLPDLSPDDIRRYLLYLAERRNGGGCHASYRCIRALLNWAWEEFEFDGRNPILRVEAPKRNTQILPGISIENVSLIVEVCQNDKLAKRDKAILMFMTDTGVRASELTSLRIGDFDVLNGTATIRHGKGDKHRIVYVGRKTLRAIRSYLRERPDIRDFMPLFPTDEGNQFSLQGLRRMIEKRAAQAGVPVPALHDFRRCFAVECLRNGMDLLTVSRLLGHSSITVTQRYLFLLDEDLQKAHRRGSPVDSKMK